MTTYLKPLPKGFHTITPLITVEGADKTIEFLKQAFDARELSRMLWPDGSILHAELQIGDSILMLGEAKGDCKPMPASLYLYVDDVDATYNRALEAGATAFIEPVDQFYGDRHGGVQDPAGNRWNIATHIEDVSPGEMRRRAEEWMKQREQELASVGPSKA